MSEQTTVAATTDNVTALNAVQQLLLLRTLQAGFRAAEDTLRDEVAASMAPGDRRFGVGPVAGGKVTKSKPTTRTDVRVTDPRALGEWLVDHGYNDRVVPMPDEYVTADIKAASLRAGAPCGPGGEADVPGIEVVEVTSQPETKVYADKNAAAVVTQRWQELVERMPAELLTGEGP